MVLTSEEVTSLISNPDLAAEKANLQYVSENDLCIMRRKRGKGYQYFKDGEPLQNKKELERIKKLVIPPAWEKVKICPLLQRTSTGSWSRRKKPEAVYVSSRLD